MNSLAKFATFPLRIGVGLVFLYFGLAKFLWPSRDISQMIELGIPQQFAPLLNFLMGILEVLIAVAMLLGVYVKYAAIAAATMITLILAGFTIKFGKLGFDTIFRDIAILGAAISLAIRCDDRFCLINRDEKSQTEE